LASMSMSMVIQAVRCMWGMREGIKAEHSQSAY
jgi:hypothetical protein